jgi:hypothetical protein
MDGTRFDALIRALAPRPTRRSVLVGALAALAAGRTADRARAAPRSPGAICRTPGECASGVCVADATGRGRCGPRSGGCVPAGAWLDWSQRATVGPLPPGSYLITDTGTGASKVVDVPYFSGSDAFLLAGLRCPESPPFYTGPLITFGGGTEDGVQEVCLAVYDPAATECSGRAAYFTVTPL